MASQKHVLLLVLLCGGLAVPPADASCASARRFDSNIGIFSVGEFTGNFWALGHGSPFPGQGIDNGSNPLCEWAFDSYPAPNCVVYPGYTPFHLHDDWSSPGVDGCIDEAGATPQLDGDECMVAVFSDGYGNFDGWPTFAVLSERAAPGGPDPDTLWNFDGPFELPLGPILTPTVTGGTGTQTQASLTLKMPPGTLGGQFLDPDCTSGVVQGYRIRSHEVTPGAAPPWELLVDAGWQAATPPLPFGTETTLEVSCGGGQDLYLAATFAFDSGFETGHVSRPSVRIPTASDSDADGVADACDLCTDVDGDAFGDAGGLGDVCPEDNCAGASNPSQSDADGDGAGDACDVCPGFLDPRPKRLLHEANAAYLLRRFAFSADGARALYLAIADAPGFELWSAPAGGGSAIKLNGPLVPGGNVTEFWSSPDGETVVYRADQDVDGYEELYAVPAAGGPVTRLAAPFAVEYEIPYPDKVLRFSPDGSRVVYRTDDSGDGAFGLYSVPIDAGAPPVKLSAPLPAGGDVADFSISPDGSRVLYRARQETGGLYALYGVPITGQSPLQLNRPRPGSYGANADARITPDGAKVVFVANERSSTFELWTVPFDAAELPSLLSPELTPGGNVDGFRIGSGGTTVVYRADQDVDGVFELYRIGVDGGPASKLNGPLVPGGNVAVFELTPDGATVVYAADQDVDARFELYSVPVVGGAATRISGPMQPDGDVSAHGPSGFAETADAFKIGPADGFVVYRADAVVDGKFEVWGTQVGAGNASRLSDMPNLIGVFSYAFTADGTTVVFRASAASSTDLYATSVEGGTPRKLSGPPVTVPTDIPGIPYLPEDLYAVGASGPRALYRSADGLYSTLVGCNVPCADEDGDGRCAGTDNCPGASNPGQEDLDSDGAGDACDCAPQDPGARSPAAVSSLLLMQAGGTTHLSWSVAQGADHYAVTRGALEVLGAGQYGACVATDLMEPQLDDPSMPDGGHGFVFLVQGTSSTCGTGTLGYDSAGEERINGNPSACP